MRTTGDLIGKTFARLTVLRLAPKTRRDTDWTCLCSCGNVKNVSTNHLTSGAVRSCGCLRLETARVSGLKRRKEYQHPTHPRLYYTYARQASKRGHAFELSDALFTLIVTSNCTYCGEKPTLRKSPQGMADEIANGIDRVDNSIGYIP